MKALQSHPAMDAEPCIAIRMELETALGDERITMDASAEGTDLMMQELSK